MESITNYYDTLKNNPKLLFLIIGKYVKVNLIQDRSICGYVYTIDPEEHSIILMQLCKKDFETILILGHAILEILLILDPTPKTTMSVSNSTADLVERKQKLISWFKQNHLSVSMSEENTEIIEVLGIAKVIPPYNIINIHSTNLFITKQVKEVLENMPIDYIAT